MEVPTIEDKIVLDKKELVKIHLFIKMIEKGIAQEFSYRELDILAELYCFGGTTSKINIQEFIDYCFKKNLSKDGSINSIRNVLTKGRRFKIIKRKKANFWQIDKEYLPPVTTEFMAFKYFFTNISHAKNELPHS